MTAKRTSRDRGIFAVSVTGQASVARVLVFEASADWPLPGNFGGTKDERLSMENIIWDSFVQEAAFAAAKERGGTVSGSFQDENRRTRGKEPLGMPSVFFSVHAGRAGWGALADAFGRHLGRLTGMSPAASVDCETTQGRDVDEARTLMRHLAVRRELGESCYEGNGGKRGPRV